MKKRLVMLLAGLLTVLSMGFGLAQFSDVPAGHWAKEAVEALAAKGIIVGFPDGTYRGNETLTRYQAALLIYRLLQQIEEELKAKGESPTMEAMAPEDLEALKNAVQELAAELAALGVRVSALEDSAATKEDIARLEAMIEELRAMPMPEVEPGMDQAALQDLADRVEAASIAADTALAQAQQLSEQLEALAQEVEGVKGDLAALGTQVEANAQAIQALNELAVLLNQDVLALQDRVTALEKGLADLQGVDFEQFATKEDLAAVQEFAAALRSDLVGLSEKVSKLEGQVAELSKVQYSISGSLTATYGLVTLSGSNFDIDRLFSTPFSTGVFGASGQVASAVALEDVASRNLSRGAATLTFTVKNTAPKAQGVDFTEASASLGVAAFGGTFTSIPTIRLDAASVKGSVDGQPSSVAYSRLASRFKFNDYLFVNDNDPAERETRQGLVAEADLNKLPLSPKVTVVAGVSDPADNGGAGGNLQGNYFGIRVATKPFAGLDLALSYAANGGPSPTRSALGLDGSLKLGDFSVKGLFVTSKTTNIGGYFQDYFDPAKADWAYYVQLSAQLGPVGLKANYRAIDPDYANGVAGMSASHLAYYGGVKGRQSPAPYPANQEGVGVNLDATLGPLALEAYGDSYGSYPYNPGSITTDLGAAATLGLPMAFSLKVAYDTKYTGASYFDVSSQTASTVTGTLSHKGDAQDALVKDLNLTLQGTYDTISSTFGLAAYGTYKLGLGPLSLDTLLFRYADPNTSASGDETLKGGLKASVDLGGLLPLKPKLLGEVAARQTGGTGGTEELKWGVGLSLGEFLFPGSSLEARYAEYRASNVASLAVGAVDHAFRADKDVLYSGSGVASGSLAGFNVTWRYYDLRADYGEYLTSAGDHARTFRITYTVKF